MDANPSDDPRLRQIRSTNPSVSERHQIVTAGAVHIDMSDSQLAATDRRDTLSDLRCLMDRGVVLIHPPRPNDPDQSVAVYLEAFADGGGFERRVGPFAGKDLDGAVREALRRVGP